MMRLNITIDMSNAAFGDTCWEQAVEVERLLAKVVTAVSDCGDAGVLHDVNGNTVCSWAIITGRST